MASVVRVETFNDAEQRLRRANALTTLGFRIVESGDCQENLTGIVVHAGLPAPDISGPQDADFLLVAVKP